MIAARLVIRKGMVNIGGKNRPVIQTIAIIEPRLGALLNEHFQSENLFKRSMYSGGLPQGVPAPSGSMAPMLANFVKNDACPEVTVKSLLAGQTFQGNSIWDVMCFEYVAKRSFDALCELAACAAELGTETTYSRDIDIAAFEADTAAEKLLLEAAA